jgi:hypothetical protein
MKKTNRLPNSKLPAIYVHKGHRYRWPVDVYEEWYEYCRLANKLPEDLKADSFTQWFKPELFEEPLHDNDVKVIKQQQNKLTVEIDMTFNMHRIGMSFLTLMYKYKKRFNKEITAQYSPSQSKKDMKFNAIVQARQIYMLKQQGLKNLEVAKQAELISAEIYDYKTAIKNKTKKITDFDPRKADVWETTYKNAVRTIQRNVQLATSILANVEKGSFP